MSLIPQEQLDSSNQQTIGSPSVGSSSFFQMMMDNAPDLIWAKDMDNRYTFANRAVCDTLLKCDIPGGAVGKSDLYFAAKERRRGYLHTFGDICVDSDEVVKTTGEAGSFIEEGFVRGKYLILDVHKAPLFNDAGDMVGTVGSARDITLQRAAELALKESETRFRTLFNVITDAVFVHPFARKGFRNFIEVNEVALQMYGYTREEFLAMSPQDLSLDPEGKGLGSAVSRRNLEMSGVRMQETLSRKKNNEIFPVEVSSSVFDFHGEKLVLSAVRDITDRRQSEKEREEAVRFAAEQEKYALVGQVAGKMAHDFNNILSGIMGNAEISLMDCKDGEMKTTLEIILEQTLRGKNLTKNLVAFARDQEPKEEFFSINEKLELMLKLMRKELEGMEVALDLAPDLPQLLADPGMIEHALVNLLQNAVHAMSKVGRPLLRISTARSKSKDSLVIKIRDNGCGIPDRYYDRIYTPAFTLKGSKDSRGHYHESIRGTGYGMANVKKYIQKHRGGIQFTSKEGAGTCFVITFPLINRELTFSEKQRMENKPVVKNRKILLVEDEPAISGVLKKILTQAPFFHEVRVAADGQEAVEAFDREAFDLISLDYLLPGRLNGMDIYAHIRRANPDIPVVFLSGNMGFIESIKDISSQDHRVAHLAKPCENIVYADTVNDWLLQIAPQL